MGGDMWAESSGVPGEGLGLPLHHPSRDGRDARALPPGSARIQPSLNGKRALIVDDNATNRRILTLQLLTGACRRATVKPPAEALKWIKRGDPFDLAILDMHMPGMDGVTLAGRIRKQRDAKKPAAGVVHFAGPA